MSAAVKRHTVEEPLLLLKSKRFWIGLVITLVCLVLAFQGIQPDKVLDAFARINWLWLPFLIMTFMISYAGRAFRWQALFYPYHPRWSRVFGTLNIGYFLSNITPARIGDFVRAYLLGTLENIPVARALSTVLIERIMDGLTVVVLLVVLLPWIPNLPNEWRNGGLVFGLVGIALVVVLLLLSFQKEKGIAFLQKISSPIPLLRREGLWRFIGHLIDGLSVIREPRPLLIAILWSFEVWLVASVLAWMTMFAMGINNLPLTAGIAIQVFTALGVAVAASPGQIGVFHLIALTVLTKLFGLDPNIALAYAFAFHGMTYILLSALGLGSAWREGLNLARIRDISSKTSKNDDDATNLMNGSSDSHDKHGDPAKAVSVPQQIS